MKQIIPFQKELLFKTKVSDITSISLEHTLKLVEGDSICGEFYITGDYKMTEGSIQREKFDFSILVDITLDSKYKADSLVIDIDNFYYEVINNESLKVNIDVYIEGDKEVDSPDRDILVEDRDNDKEVEVELIKNESIDSQKIEDEGKDNISILDNDVVYSKPSQVHFDEKDVQDEFNIFENIDEADTYVTYYVYIVKEEDTLDKIIEKYGVSREEISLYNQIEDIKPGVKLIIPNVNG